jgi:hypothetical protein
MHELVLKRLMSCLRMERREMNIKRAEMASHKFHLIRAKLVKLIYSFVEIDKDRRLATHTGEKKVLLFHSLTISSAQSPKNWINFPFFSAPIHQDLC